MKFSHTRPLPRIAIIGGGFGGIGLGVQLKKAGIHSFEIFEKSANLGGVWWDNRYPGAEVDTPSVMYSFSFEPYRWSRTHVRQAELLEYMEYVAQKHGLMDHVHTSTEVTRADWNDDAQRYTVTFGDGTQRDFEVVVSAVGLLSDPRYPTWPGLDSFEGEKFHTSRWDSSIDLTGKRVAVVGTGSTAVQVVPNIAPIAGEVKLFQREPGWVLPKGAQTFGPAEREALNDPIAQKLVRWGMLIQREKFQYRNAAWRPGTPQNAASERAAREYIARVFAERPDLAELVTPSYPFGGKRPILTDDFYPSLLRDNVELVPHAVDTVTPNGLVDRTGVHHEIDVLVMSTGFKSSFASTFDLTGQHGIDLHTTWAGDDQAFLGIMVPSFPNFFMLYGPNTNGGAIVTHLEEQIRYVVAAIKYQVRNGFSALYVDEAITAAYNAILQDRLKGTSFDGVNNYYASASGRIITQWSDGAIVYGVATRLLRRVAWRGKRVVRSSVKPPVVLPVDGAYEQTPIDDELEMILQANEV
ncbi:flavin-containing monooxygenase [Agromyces aerolatus]|uniref:flavin-containing monooxygenase n=1 Tax=Agromyces sp. LY-1074 TaxID=3074080 RepID=UPI00285B3AED|nr:MULTISPECIES: NAD(P)/FAD-dependent oxidoreductase [unclassified Agromyces]MDR5699095.1 NAD(P)/FAD-dependent oxidoreductase [Agromyces sp. LY-1074]MDR5705126.1 NAD(P)/FAD-dependent oxidoreductase [Agromyces sp. LY-1358]